MYGPAFLVNPVTEPAATSRAVYLPNAKWYDFWSGAATDGGKESLPPPQWIGCRSTSAAGSILPLGPDVEWSTEKPADPIELRIYRGATASSPSTKTRTIVITTKRGVYATIPLRWDEAKKNVDHRGSARTIPRHARQPGVSCRLCQ